MLSYNVGREGGSGAHTQACLQSQTFVPSLWSTSLTLHAPETYLSFQVRGALGFPLGPPVDNLGCWQGKALCSAHSDFRVAALKAAGFLVNQSRSG